MPQYRPRADGTGRTRRAVLGGGVALMSAPAAFAAWSPAQVLPDPAIHVLDESFSKYRLTTASIERLVTGFRWSEGPVWFGDQRCVIWSDVPNNRLMRWSEATGLVDEFRKPSNYGNGNARDLQGRLVTCEELTRRVTRTEYDGSITVLADRYDGKRLNSPNDVAVKNDGSVWFTDPTAGIISNYEGEIATEELPTGLYRVNSNSGAISLMTNEMNWPNGLAFSPDYQTLYVIESRATPRVIWAYGLTSSGTQLGKRRLVYKCQFDETPDGMRVDSTGMLWVGWGMGKPGLDGVRVMTPDGHAIAHISLPERCANLCFGGLHKNRLFMAASHSLYSLYLNVSGLP